MTAAQLRAMTNTAPVLPCSPVRLVDTSGREWRIVRMETVTPRDAEGKPTGVPVAVAVIEQEGETSTIVRG